MILVVAAAVYYAFYGLFSLKQRLAAIRELTGAMFCVRSAIAFSGQPVKDVFAGLEKSETTGVFGNFTKGMAAGKRAEDIWNECMDMTPLDGEEKAVFMPFGACLCAADRSAQLKTIDMMTNAAKLCENRLLQRIDSYKAVDMKIRIMCGLMAALLLI